MLRLERHPLGWTVGLTFAVCLLLSVLPLPDAARPFPKLLKTPRQAFVDVFLPGDGAPPVQPPAPVLDELEVAAEEAEFPEMDLSGAQSAPLPPAHVKETKQLERLAEKVGAVQTEVEQPCLAPNPSGCRRLALAPMFEAAKAHGAPVRAVVLGTSLIASDHITDVLRRRLQTRHGDGGLGFMFVDRPTRGAGRTVRSGEATPGWGIAKVTDEAWPKNAGLPGVMFQARGDAPQRTRFKPPPGTRRLELYLMGQPGGGTVQVLADGVQVGQVETRADAPTPLFPVVPLPPDVKELVLATKDGPVRLDGVVLETGGPGFVLDSLGLPGSTATVLLRDDEALFTAQLKVRGPQLVIFMIGGNEAFDISLNRYTPQEARDRMQLLIRRVKAAVPGAACLLASPPDGGLWRMDQTVAVREQTKVVAAFMRKLAVQERCAYYDMQEAMGGEGSVERWWKAGLMNRDLIHPVALGGDLMGYLLDEALERARVRTELASAKAARPRRAPVARPREASRGAERLGSPTTGAGARAKVERATVALGAPQERACVAQPGQVERATVALGAPQERACVAQPGQVERATVAPRAGACFAERVRVERATAPRAGACVAERVHSERATVAPRAGASAPEPGQVERATVAPRAGACVAERVRVERATVAARPGHQRKRGQTGAEVESPAPPVPHRRKPGALDGGIRTRRAHADAGSLEFSEEPRRRRSSADAGFVDAESVRPRRRADAGFADAPRSRLADAGFSEAPRSRRPEAAVAVDSADALTAFPAADAVDEEPPARATRSGGSIEDTATPEALAPEPTARRRRGLPLLTLTEPVAAEGVCLPSSARAFCAPSHGDPALGAHPEPQGPLLEGGHLLAPFFKKLQALQTEGNGRVAVAQLGASHTAAQFFTDQMRALLAARFGYAGRGYVAAGKASDRLLRSGAWRELSAGWTVLDALKDGKAFAGSAWGLTGVRVVGKPGAQLTVGFDDPAAAPDDRARLQVFWQQGADAGVLEVSVDGEAPTRPEISPSSPVQLFEVSAPGGTHRVQLTNVGTAPLSVFGVSHELDRPGVVYDALGLPGSTVMTLDSYAREPLIAQLKARDAALFVLFYGTNESALKPAPTVEHLEQAYPHVIATLREAAPGAACLLLGPTDRQKRDREGRWKAPAALDDVDVALSAIAARQGCAYWSTRTVMGGPGAIDRWRRAQPPLALPDHVHLTQAGYQLLARALATELFTAYGQWQAAP